MAGSGFSSKFRGETAVMEAEEAELRDLLKGRRLVRSFCDRTLVAIEGRRDRAIGSFCLVRKNILEKLETRWEYIGKKDVILNYLHVVSS